MNKTQFCVTPGRHRSLGRVAIVAAATLLMLATTSRADLIQLAVVPAQSTFGMEISIEDSTLPGGTAQFGKVTSYSVTPSPGPESNKATASGTIDLDYVPGVSLAFQPTSHIGYAISGSYLPPASPGAPGQMGFDVTHPVNGLLGHARLFDVWHTFGSVNTLTGATVADGGPVLSFVSDTSYIALPSGTSAQALLSMDGYLDVDSTAIVDQIAVNALGSGDSPLANSFAGNVATFDGMTLELPISSTFSFTEGTSAYTITTTGTLVAVLVPEPSNLSLLLCVGGIGLVGLARRSQRWPHLFGQFFGAIQQRRRLMSVIKNRGLPCDRRIDRRTVAGLAGCVALLACASMAQAGIVQFDIITEQSTIGLTMDVSDPALPGGPAQFRDVVTYPQTDPSNVTKARGTVFVNLQPGASIELLSSANGTHINYLISSTPNPTYPVPPSPYPGYLPGRNPDGSLDTSNSPSKAAPGQMGFDVFHPVAGFLGNARLFDLVHGMTGGSPAPYNAGNDNYPIPADHFLLAEDGWLDVVTGILADSIDLSEAGPGGGPFATPMGPYVSEVTSNANAMTWDGATLTIPLTTRLKFTDDTTTYDITTFGQLVLAPAVPEPPAVLMAGLGAVGLVSGAWRVRKQRARAV